MITGIHHITINVKNLTQTHRFYGELLGLTRLEDIDMAIIRFHIMLCQSVQN